MTSEFDDLMAIYSAAEGRPKYEKIALWLADICVEEAGRHRKDWNFESWSRSRDGRMYRAVLGEKWLKFKFLDETHSVLDHYGGLHHRVFTAETCKAIEIVARAVKGSLMIPYAAVYQELDRMLSELGYVRSGSVWLKKG